MTTWTRVTDPDTAATLLPAWFARRMMASRGSYGFLLGTGDVLRVSRVTSIHLSSTGVILADVLLDPAGVPPGLDSSWQGKRFLGAPAIGATLATVNLARVELAFEFEAPEIAEVTGQGGAAGQLPVLPTPEAVPAD